MAAMAQRIALVTGAASGLGRATAERIVKQGGKVVICDLNEEGRNLAQELGSNAIFAKVDVTSEADVTAALDLSLGQFGSNPNAVVNCAGLAIAKKTLSKKGVHSLEDFNKVLQVNVGGSYNTARLAAARMAESSPYNDSGERGVIVNTASVAAFDGQIGQCAYTSSKGAIHALTLPLSREMSEIGVRVNTIAPGIFSTPMMAGLPEKAQKALAATVPFPKRLGIPDEYAALVQFMMESGYINGETIRLDGGIRMPPK